jgi:hypothetical protein
MMVIVNECLQGTMAVMKVLNPMTLKIMIITVEGTADRNKDADESNSNSRTPISQSTECKGSADCFRRIVTEIVDVQSQYT